MPSAGCLKCSFLCATEEVAEVVTEVEIGVEITEKVEALIDTLMEEAVHALTENFASI